MRLIASSIFTVICASTAAAQILIVPQDGPGASNDDINIKTEENLSWEEAANHRDITVMRSIPNGLEAVSPEELVDADPAKLLQKRKAIKRLDDQPDAQDIEYVPNFPEAPKKNVLQPAQSTTQENDN